MAFLTISLAYTIPKMGGILHGIDISYGLYLYHMIVVNVFVELGFVGEWKYGLASLALSVLLGLISWLLIEKKALSLKDVKFRIPFRNEQRLWLSLQYQWKFFFFFSSILLYVGFWLSLQIICYKIVKILNINICIF